MKTIIFIHGGESFTTHEEYTRFLRNTYVDWQSVPWTPEDKTTWVKEIAKKWHTNGGVVYMPILPNKLDAKYEEWKIVFEGILSKLHEKDEVTLVGGSLGGCFLLKYFSEMEDSPFVIPSKAEESLSPELARSTLTNTHKMNLKGIPTGGQKTTQVSQVHLVAACISAGDFSAPANYESLQQLGKQVHIWHSEDDRVVPFEIAKTLSNVLPAAQTHFFGTEKGYGHFHGIERFSELETLLVS